MVFSKKNLKEFTQQLKDYTPTEPTPQPQTYTITVSVENGSYTGDTTINTDGTATVTITANFKHLLPAGILVLGASYTWNSSTGVITLSNPTANVRITAICKLRTDFLEFNSPTSFTLNVVDNQKYWDGTLYYSTDLNTWNTWSGTSAISSASTDGTHYLFVRGTGNTYITGENANSSTAAWRLNGSNISIKGNIENLLSYTTVSQGNHPTMAAHAYHALFAYPAPDNVPVAAGYNITDVSELVLPALNLTDYCYTTMFQGEAAITTTPDMRATASAPYCCRWMFNQCRSLVNVSRIRLYSLKRLSCMQMFQFCTSLVNPPEWDVKTIENTQNCQYMFYGCTSLVSPIKMSQIQYTGTSTADGHQFYQMYYGCVNLNKLPKINITLFTDSMCKGMFENCTKIKLSRTQTGEYQTAYRIPVTGTGTGEWSSTFADMFKGTGGTFTGSPIINSTYYTSNELV